MPLVERTEDDDGNVSITVRKIDKVIRAADGTLRKMVSFDGGETWVWDKKAHKEQSRLNNVARLQEGRRRKKDPDFIRWPESWDEEKRQEIDARTNPGVQAVPLPVILPVTRYGSRPVKKTGKNQKYRKNLRPKKERNVRILRPVHFHRCHGEKFICACATPKVKRLCGGKEGEFCLHASIQEEFARQRVAP